MRIDVFNISQLSQVQFDFLLKGVEDSDQKEILRFKNHKDRVYRLISRLMLKKAFVESGKPIKDFVVLRDYYNKPYIPEWYAFNISHSGSYVVLAYSKEARTVGIDIEEITEIEIESIIGSFHKSEISFLRKERDQRKAFYHLWSKKEALLKAFGVGIVQGLNQFSALADHVLLEGQNYVARKVPFDPLYSLWVATSNEEEIQIQLVFISEVDLIPESNTKLMLVSHE